MNRNAYLKRNKPKEKNENQIWENHLNREAKQKYERSVLIDKNTPSKTIFDENENMKNELRNMMNPNRKGDSFLDGFKGDPIEFAHQKRSSKREKLKKYFYAGKQDNTSYENKQIL